MSKISLQESEGAWMTCRNSCDSMLHLLFDLEGVLAGFGAVAMGGERRVSDAPTRSGVLGLIHACMGIDRSIVHAGHEAVKGLNVAVAVRDPGSVMVDYHTTFNQETEQTVESRRGYRTGVHYVVAVWGHDQLLKEARAALGSPVWTPYLGRRSCPLSAPMNPELVEASTLREALESRDAAKVRVVGDEHPHPDIPEVSRTHVPDWPSETSGDRRTFENPPLVTYGGAE